MKQIDVLPDEVLLEIFDFYVDPSYKVCPTKKSNRSKVEAWQSLIHVCRRWRSLVFRSPRRLNLRLFWTTRARDTLDVWPPLLPIVLDNIISSSGTDNIIAALGQNNRVCQISLYGHAHEQFGKTLAAMQVPFPELTDLVLYLFSYSSTPVIPNSFLGGSSPRLRSVTLGGIPFQGLPNLLLSTTHLIELKLTGLPHSGYISPEAIVALISELSSLETLSLKFPPPQSRSDWESQGRPPLVRSILPALHKFHFLCNTEYLEDLVTRIDTPQLNEMDITFFSQTDFDCPQLVQFISRSPSLKTSDEARVEFGCSFFPTTASIALPAPARSRTLKVGIQCSEDRQLSSVAQVCNSILPLSTVEDLYVKYHPTLVWNNDANERLVESALWLQLLLSFTAVKNLYISKEIAPGIAAALQEIVGEGITEVLSGLQNIFVEGLGPSGTFQKNIGQFIALRQLSDHPIAISVWTDSKMKPM